MYCLRTVLRLLGRGEAGRARGSGCDCSRWQPCRTRHAVTCQRLQRRCRVPARSETLSNCSMYAHRTCRPMRAVASKRLQQQASSNRPSALPHPPTHPPTHLNCECTPSTMSLFLAKRSTPLVFMSRRCTVRGSNPSVPGGGGGGGRRGQRGGQQARSLEGVMRTAARQHQWLFQQGTQQRLLQQSTHPPTHPPMIRLTMEPPTYRCLGAVMTKGGLFTAGNDRVRQRGRGVGWVWRCAGRRRARGDVAAEQGEGGTPGGRTAGRGRSAGGAPAQCVHLRSAHPLPQWRTPLPS